MSTEVPSPQLSSVHRFRLPAAEIGRRYGLVIAWVILIAVFAGLRPDTFATFGNFKTIASSQAVLVILTLGLLIPFSAGEFDISIAGVMSIALVLVGWLNVIHGWPIGWAVAVALAAGVVVGIVNGFFVIVMDVDSIVATLGMGTLLTGIGVGVNNLSTGGISDSLVSAVRHEIFNIPALFYYGLGATALVWYVFEYTPIGRYLYFVGAGRDVARLSGIRVDAVRFGSFIASAFMAAIAGVTLSGLIGAADPNIAMHFLLPAFAAAFLGATAIKPGRFNAWGTLIAVYFLVTGITGLEFLGYSGWVEQVFYGASLILAVAFSRLAARRLAT